MVKHNWDTLIKNQQSIKGTNHNYQFLKSEGHSEREELFVRHLFINKHFFYNIFDIGY